MAHVAGTLCFMSLSRIILVIFLEIYGISKGNKEGPTLCCCCRRKLLFIERGCRRRWGKLSCGYSFNCLVYLVISSNRSFCSVYWCHRRRLVGREGMINSDHLTRLNLSQQLSLPRVISLWQFLVNCQGSIVCLQDCPPVFVTDGLQDSATSTADHHVSKNRIFVLWKNLTFDVLVSHLYL